MCAFWRRLARYSSLSYGRSQCCRGKAVKGEAWLTNRGVCEAVAERLGLGGVHLGVASLIRLEVHGSLKVSHFLHTGKAFQDIAS